MPTPQQDVVAAQDLDDMEDDGDLLIRDDDLDDLDDDDDELDGKCHVTCFIAR